MSSFPHLVAEDTHRFVLVRNTHEEVISMLRWAVIFLVVAIVAAVFGFTGIAATAAGIAKFLFFLFLAMCLILFIIGMSVGRKIS